MTTNLRASLAILSLGFGIEGSGELYAFVARGAYHPGVGFLFVLPSVVTVAGLLFVGVGQHEWNALHRARVRQAHFVFGLSVLGAFVGALVVPVLVLAPSLGTPAWARGLFGVGVGSLVLGTFVTYALLVFHLVPRPSKALLLAALGWALGVAAFVGGAMASSLPTIVGLVARRTPVPAPTLLGPIGSLVSYLFVSYFLLLAAYVEAHRAVLRGPETRPRSATAALPAPIGPSGSGGRR